MYQAWPRAQQAGVSRTGAVRAIRRYRAGRIPTQPVPGLAPKSVKSVAIMLGSAMSTANPTDGVKAPAVRKGAHRTWNAEQMSRFLDTAREDRFYALWVLAATTGMRRSELCGLRRDTAALDLTAAKVRMTSTRVIAAGTVSQGSDKSPGSRRSMSMDSFTVAVLQEALERLTVEIDTAGADYQDHGVLFCWQDGRPINPDTVTERFNTLVDQAGVPAITLHEVRHSYATIALRSGVHPKIVSTRLGRATVAFTLDVYSADIPDLDEQAAESISSLFVPAVTRSPR